MSKISAMLITYNEAANIKECLERIKWVDQIVVVDTGSTDQTVSLAREYTDQVYQIPRSDFSTMRNAALQYISGDWLLILDADEWVSPELADKIQQLLASEPDKDGYEISRHNHFLGKWMRHSGWGTDKVLRLIKFSPELRWDEPVHERIYFRGSMGELKGHVDHFTCTSIEQYLAKHNLYTTLNVEKYYGKGKKVNLARLLYRPVMHFIKEYFLKGGFLDGSYGFIICYLDSFMVFIRSLKLWLKYQQHPSKAESLVISNTGK